MADCPQNTTAQKYHDGELAPGDRAGFEAHLAHCPACQRELAALEQLRLAIHQAFAAEALADDTIARLQRRAYRANEAAVLIRLALRGIAAAAAVLVICSAMLWQPWMAPNTSAAIDPALETLAVMPPSQDAAEPNDNARIANWIVADLSRANGHD